MIKKSEIVIDIGTELRVDQREGLRAVILGRSGSGKSYLAARMVEELIQLGFTVVIFDVEGEWWTLSEKYNVIIVGRTVPLVPEASEEYVDVILNNTSIIFDFSAAGMSDPEARDFYVKVADNLFERIEGRSAILVFEEADVFAPQIASRDMRPAAELSSRIARRGRKRGIHSIWISQRPALLSKDVLSQANVILLGKMSQERDLAAVKPYVGGNLVKELPSLDIGEFLLVTGEAVERFRVAKRRTPHGADTPFNPAITGKMPEDVIDTLKAAIEEKIRKEKQKKTEIQRLKEKIRELKEIIEEKEKEIERLRTAQEAVQVIASALTGAGSSDDIKRLQATIRKLEKRVRELSERREGMSIDKESLLSKSLSKDEMTVYLLVKNNQPISKGRAEILLKGELGYTRFHKAWRRLERLGLIKQYGHGRWYAQEI